ncbi:MAG: PD-(D/E)XK nuclease family protein [Methanoregula sp.]
MTGRLYQELRNQINLRPERQTTPRYSVTGDILSFQICRRQYGFFTHRKYTPAHVVQAWYGQIIHQVLDKLHLHYSGSLNPAHRGILPTDDEVEAYFNAVDQSLRAKGLHHINSGLRVQALRVIKKFNQIEGATLYPRIIDTECNFQSTHGNFILEGVVDVLSSSTQQTETTQFAQVEIWDYKGSKYPNPSTDSGKTKLQRYIFQMMVYAELYRLKMGQYPLKANLYFVNELDKSNISSRPDNAIFEIDFTNPENLSNITNAIEKFCQTVREIEDCKAHDQWNPPAVMPDEETCTICDKRWDCSAVGNHFPMRYP